MKLLTACAWTTLATLGLLAHLVANDPKCITFKLHPPASVKSLEDVIVELHIQSDPANIEAVVVIDGDDYYTADTIQLRGEQSPASFQRSFPRVPAGVYLVTAVLYRHDARTWIAGRDVQRLTIGTP